MINILQLPLSPLPKTTYPELSREIARHEWPNVRYILRRGSMLSASYSLPVAAILILFGQWIITIWFDTAFLPAYPALLILLVGYTFVNIFFWNRVALLALNRPVFPTMINFIGMLFKVAGVYLLVPIHGYLAFAALLSGYYLFTTSMSAIRIISDVKHFSVVESSA